jgi:hypothetical protein
MKNHNFSVGFVLSQKTQKQKKESTFLMKFLSIQFGRTRTKEERKKIECVKTSKN